MDKTEKIESEGGFLVEEAADSYLQSILTWPAPNFLAIWVLDFKEGQGHRFVGGSMEEDR